MMWPRTRSSSPPPCGEGLGVGVVQLRAIDGSGALLLDPPPLPSPAGGEGAHRVCGTCILHNGSTPGLRP
jgi:hypothetical protein